MRLLKSLSIVALSFSILPALAAQLPKTQIVFSYIGASIDETLNLGATDIQLLDAKLRAVLLEIARRESYSITSPKNGKALLDAILHDDPETFRTALTSFGQNLTANGAIHCTLQNNAGIGMSLGLTLFSIPDGSIASQTSVQGSTLDEVIEKLQTAMYPLFGLTQPQIAGDAVPRSISTGAFYRDREISPKDLVGKWVGDYGLQRIDVKDNGTAVAWLSDTETMKLQFSIQGQTICFRQDEANSPKLYLSVFPFNVATQIVKLARPMSWDFTITVERDRLVGRKLTSYFLIEDGKVVQVDNDYSRDAVWTRIP